MVESLLRSSRFYALADDVAFAEPQRAYGAEREAAEKAREEREWAEYELGLREPIDA